MATADLDELRWALQDYLMGHAQGEQSKMRDLIARPWRLAARLEQLTRLTSLVRALDDQVLAAVAAGELDVGAEARHLAFRLAEQDAEALAEEGGEPAALDAPPQILAQMREAVAGLAARRLGVYAEAVRPGERLTLSLSTEALEKLLGEAFVAGWHSAA